MKVDAALMHKERNVIAVRAMQGENTLVQVSYPPSDFAAKIFDLEGKQKIKQAEIQDSIVYWKWINNNKIAAVTKAAVFHIDITNQEPAQRIFDR